MGKAYIIRRRDGAINVYFDELWDQKPAYLNVGDFFPLPYDCQFSNNDKYEFTQSGFELVSYTESDETYQLAGVMLENDLTTFSDLISFGLYTVDQHGDVVQGGLFAYNGTMTYKQTGASSPTDIIYDGIDPKWNVRSIPVNISAYGGSGDEAHISVNFPIFKSKTALENYIKTGEIADCWNIDEFDLDKTEYYWIYNRQQMGKLYNGKITPTSAASTWHSLKFSANRKPVLYFDDDFELQIKAPSVVASKAVLGPGYILDEIPEESWTEGSLEYEGPFYGTLAAKVNYTGSLPANGTYLYGAEVNTNIPIFKTATEAQYAIDSGDYSAAGNAYDLEDGNTHQPISIGDEELATVFGSGYAVSPFVSSYIMSKNQVINIANIFYTNDATILDNIEKGLKLFGANPYEAICGLSWFPFDLNEIVGASSQPYIYFGSYQHTGVTVDKVINLKPSGYINAGSFYIKPLFGSYRDFEPYCQLSVYLPYSGWHTLDIAKYYKKTVQVRYYVDIYTNTFACALVADGQISDVFNGNIGNTLPVSGSNLSEYANSMLRSVLGTVGGAAGGAVTGMMVAPSPVGAVAGAAIGGFAGLAKGTFEMSQKGKPKDHAQVKGAFSGSSAAYMPQYVIFRYDVHNLIVPQNLTALQGRPSSAGGKISNFSGFLKCDTVKLNTGRMTDPEISEALALLREGIFI